MDYVILLKDSPNRENAIKLISFLLEPENAAEVANFASHMSGVESYGADKRCNQTSPRTQPPSGSDRAVCSELYTGCAGAVRPYLDGVEEVNLIGKT